MMTDAEWADFEQRVKTEAIPMLHSPATHELMRASADAAEIECRPITREDFREFQRQIMGEPDYQGVTEITATVDGRHLILRFQAADLDKVDWGQLTNVVHPEDDEHPFEALVFAAKRMLAGKRGHLAPAQYPIPRWLIHG